ncbi:MAG: ATP-binding cassette domain-containing protein [Luteitalea sp.]|nr:ATP-binding cassette domain-containing protein [Luteitalea sp.]
MPTNPPPLFELTRATVTKNGRPILDDITLAIHNGEHTAIVGPNGAGKSTLINLLTHQDRAVAHADGSAAVRVLGNDRWNVFELRATLAIVSSDLHHRFVEGNSNGRITGTEAVLSGFFAARGVMKHLEITGEMRDSAARALATMDASQLGGKPMHEMSSGEARRVLIARALVSFPRALVLDEPTTGLDLVARDRCLDLVRRIARTGPTLILVTHHLEEIVPEIERVILLRRGRVAFDGPKAATLTTARLSHVFEAPVAVGREDGYYAATLARFEPAAIRPPTHSQAVRQAGSD